MFNWLKNLFKSKSTTDYDSSSFPYPTAKGQDQSALAPYKVETPVVEPIKDQITDAVTTAPKKVETKQVKKSPPKKKPATPAKTTGTRGRKPKTKPAEK